LVRKRFTGSSPVVGSSISLEIFLKKQRQLTSQSKPLSGGTAMAKKKFERTKPHIN
jgi:hypothetical protein